MRIEIDIDNLVELLFGIKDWDKERTYYNMEALHWNEGKDENYLKDYVIDLVESFLPEDSQHKETVIAKLYLEYWEEYLEFLSRENDLP